jgi:hypothetical protein
MDEEWDDEIPTEVRTNRLAEARARLADVTEPPPPSSRRG